MSNWGAPIGQPLNFNPEITIAPNSTSLNDLFKIEDDPNIENMLKIRGVILDILNKKVELNFKEINEDENYKNEGVDELVKSLHKIISEFKKLQGELSEINEKFKNEIEKITKNMRIIEGQIDYLKKLPKEFKNEDMIKDIIDKMNVYSKSILSNEKLSNVKKEYEEKFKEIQKYIYLIRKINNFNTTNMCPVCFSNQVDHFIAPCGHTYCKTCLETLIRSEDIYNINYDNDDNCAFCREPIKIVRPLYFL
jgi:type I site-specific restriction endonuclease